MKNALESFKDRVFHSVLLQKLSDSSALLQSRSFPLADKEISQLERQGNRSDNWDSVRKTASFTSCENIWNNHFMGNCVLGDCSGRILLHGKSRSCGIYDSTLEDVFLQDHVHISKVVLLQNVIVHAYAILLDIRLLTGLPRSVFGMGTPVPLGSELGSRSLRTHPEWDPESVEAFLHGDNDLRKEFDLLLENRLGEIRTDYSIVGKSACICHAGILKGVCIAPQTEMEGVLSLENVFFAPSESGPIVLGNGVICRDSILHGGASVSDGAQVFSSIIFDSAKITQQALVKNSIVGPDCVLAQGEVTSSFLGSFVSAHHQSLLISALWPGGKGNIGYGANVGSNHTGRLPDQEILPGEGCFFGLGVNVKFPSDFRNAPYTMFASGITMLPQRIGMPFSLIASPNQLYDDVPIAYNEIFPAWVLSDNFYLVRRNEKKFLERGQSRRFLASPFICREDLAKMVLEARNLLSSLSGRKYYTDKHLLELGKNVLTEENRKKALEAYAWFLGYFALERFYNLLLEPELSAGIDPNDAFFKMLLRNEVKAEEPAVAMRLFRDYLKQEEGLIRASLDKDYERGIRIQRGYQEAHRPPEEDKILCAIREKNAARLARIARMLGEG